MKTEHQKVIGLALPEDCEITRDRSNRPVLVLDEHGANYTARMLGEAQRRIISDEVRAEAEQGGADMSTYMEWWVADNAVVWTAAGGRVMVQRLEPGDLTPEDARALAAVLIEAAAHAEGEQ